MCQPAYLGACPDLGAPFQAGLCPGDTLELAAAPARPRPWQPGIVKVQLPRGCTLQDEHS